MSDEQFPADAYADEAVDNKALLRFRPREEIRDTDMILSGVTPRVEVQVSVTCMHCGAQVGEYRTGHTTTLEHPGPNPDEPFRLEIDGAAVTPDPMKMSRWIGSWLRGVVHAEPVTQDVTEDEALPQALLPPENHLTAGMSPPPPAYTEAQPHPHIMSTFRELVGANLTQLGAALHLLDVLGPMEQLTVGLTDDCGFEGSITLRVKEICRCEEMAAASNNPAVAPAGETISGGSAKGSGRGHQTGTDDVEPAVPAAEGRRRDEHGFLYHSGDASPRPGHEDPGT